MSRYKLRVLFLTKYSKIGASSRYRTLQYLPSFRLNNIDCKIMPLFDDAYLINKYAHGKGAVIDLLRALFRRLMAIIVVWRFDLVVIEYEVFPYFPAIFERLQTWLGRRYVVDYDDALFHQYDQHRSIWVRRLLGNKIATVMRLSHTVVVGNNYLADYARHAGARNVVVVPTVVDLTRYPVDLPCFNNEVFTIGWIGSPGTAKYLQSVAPALSEVCKSGLARVRLIGSGTVDLPGVPVEVVPWSEASEIELIRTFDVGIMPLPDEPWERGKCGFKLIQYMACGLPVVASPVGVNSEIVQDGANGFLAESIEDWKRALTVLRGDASLRRVLGAAGRQKVERKYCLQATGPKLADVLHGAVEGMRRHA